MVKSEDDLVKRWMLHVLVLAGKFGLIEILLHHGKAQGFLFSVFHVVRLLQEFPYVVSGRGFL